jgi:hypothetical protein
MAPSQNSPEIVACVLTWNSMGWRGPVQRKPGDKVVGEWVKQHRWAAEDWAFATDGEQLYRGWHYGFAFGHPSPERVAASEGRFHVFFYTKSPDGREGLVGAYMNARFLADDDLDEAWSKLEKAGVLGIREQQLRAAFAGDKARIKAELKVFRADRPICWKVRPEDVHVFPELLPFDTESWHPQNAHTLENLPLSSRATLRRLVDTWSPEAAEAEEAGFSTLGGASETEEGRRRQVSHLARERDSSFARGFRASRTLVGPPPSLSCDACGTNQQAAMGDYALRGFDVHHQVPLHLAPNSGRLTSTDDLCILCLRCHRLAHASGAFTVTALRTLLAAL